MIKAEYSVAPTRCVTRIRRLYEQSQEEPLGSSRLGDYVLCWVRWPKAGLTWDLWGRHPLSAHSNIYALLPMGLGSRLILQSIF